MTLRKNIIGVLAMLLIACGMADMAYADSRYDYFFQGAMVKMSAGDYEGARDLLIHCKEINPDAAEAYFFLANCYENLENDSLSMEMLTLAAEKEPDNITYKEALMPIYLQSNELDKASEIMEEIVSNTPERTDILNVLLQIYNYQRDNANALRTLDRLEIQEGQTEQIAMTRVQLYTAMGEDKKALKELKELVKAHPLDLNFRVMMGNWLLGKGKKKEAFKEYQTVLKEEPDNENALMSMMDYYRAEGKDSLANRELENLLYSNKTQQDTRLLLMKQYIRACEQSTTDSTAVLNMFNKVLSMKQNDTQNLELKLAYMTMKNMPDDSLKVVLSQILDMQPEHAQARFELIQMAWKEGDHKEMVRLAKPAQQYNPDEWSFSYFLGIGYFLNDQVDECINALEIAAEHVDETKQKVLASEMYALLGDALHKVGNTSKAFEAYENCLRLDPENKGCLNNYAYYLSEENIELEKAATMSLKTIKDEPNNATYLDTYAWILFLQERYEEAKIYIEMAVKNLDPEQDNTTIYDHQKAILEKVSDNK